MARAACRHKGDQGECLHPDCNCPPSGNARMGDSTPAIKIHLHITSADDNAMARGLYDAINELADVIPIVKLVEYDGVWAPFSTSDTPETTGKGRG